MNWTARRCAKTAWAVMPGDISPTGSDGWAAGPDGMAERCEKSRIERWKRGTMTLYELSLEYRGAADMLRTRITELERACREERDGQRRVKLDRRLRPLRAMYRDTRAVARYLEGYYQGTAPRRPVRSRRLRGQKGD